MKWFGKRDEIERYEADWPEEYDYEEPLDTLYMSEEEQYHQQKASSRSRKRRILLMVLSGYLLFIIIGVAVTWTYPVHLHQLFKEPVQVSVQGWEQRESYRLLKAEYTQIEALWEEDIKLNQKTVDAVNNKETLVPLQMGYNKVGEKLSAQIQYTSTMSVDPNYVTYVNQMISLEKSMQQFNQLMNTALVNRDATAISQAQALDAQIQQGMVQLKQNLDGIGKVLRITE